VAKEKAGQAQTQKTPKENPLAKKTEEIALYLKVGRASGQAVLV
jgi:hypothetical protein